MTATLDNLTNSLAAGYRLLWYEIRSVLGQGGFGITYLALDTNLDQHVAIKEYLPSLVAARGPEQAIAPTSVKHRADFDWGLKRFVEEGRVLARFDHPGIVRVYSVFEANGTAYLVMRYEQGETLDALLKREQRLPEARIRQILDDVMAGLEQVHAAGFIHRDIKPGNIYLRQDGRALLIDFGAARQALGSQTQTLTALVSPGYAPLEQYRTDGFAQGPWTDIYALGATAYRAIAGRTPLPAVDRSHRILDGTGDALQPLTQLPLEDYSWGLRAAIDRALAFRETERPATVAAWRGLFDGDEPATMRTVAAAVDSSVEPETAARASVNDATLVATLLLAPNLNTRSSTGGETITPAAAAAAPVRPALARIRLPLLGASALALVIVLALTTRSDRGSAPPPLHPPAAAPAPGTAPLNSPPAVAPPAGSAAHVAATEMPAAADPTRALLTAADQDLWALRLTTPPGNNAWEKYRAVLRIDPNNAEAKTGIDKIVGRYLDLASQAALRKDFTAANDYLRRAAGVNPGDPRVQAAFLELARAEERADQQALASAAPPTSPRTSRNKPRDYVDEYLTQPARNGVRSIRKAIRKLKQ